MTLFPASIASCSTSITIIASLDTSGSYSCVMVDKFNNYYNPAITVDSHGAILLDLTQFPKGLFTPFSGAFQLMVYKVPDHSSISITMCDTIYNGFSITFYNGASLLPAIIEC